MIKRVKNLSMSETGMSLWDEIAVRCAVKESSVDLNSKNVGHDSDETCISEDDKTVINDEDDESKAKTQVDYGPVWNEMLASENAVKSVDEAQANHYKVYNDDYVKEPTNAMKNTSHLYKSGTLDVFAPSRKRRRL